MKVGTGGKRILIPVALALVLIAGGVAAVMYFGATSAATAEQIDTDGDDGATSAGVEHASKDATDQDADKKEGEEGEEGKEGEKKDGDKKDGKDKKTPVPVSVTPIVKGSVSSYISSTANLVSEDEVQILAEAEGRVDSLLVEEGDLVRKGQVLATLVKDDAEIALNKAKLKSANAKMAYERAVKMLEQELMSQEDFDKLSMDNNIAAQELAEAEWKLEKTTIRAPFAGHITARNITVGKHVRVPDHLFTVADFDPLIARIFLPENDIYGLQVGRDVRIGVKASENLAFRGRIRQISPVVDTATGTVKVTVEAIKPPSDVRPGAFVSIDIVRETRDDVTLLPREAVIRELQDAYVFIANGEVAEKRPVRIGLEEGTSVQALSGVEPGEQVITAGQGGLKDGSPIKVIPTVEASDMAVNSIRPKRG